MPAPGGRHVRGGGRAPAAGLTKADLLEKGLVGAGSAGKRRTLQDKLGLPARLTANGLLEALDLLMTREEFDALFK